MRDVGKIAIALLVVSTFVGLILISPAVSAHSGGFYTIMLRPDDWSEKVQPSIARISQNDTAVWRNVDDTHVDNGNSENVSYHRILVDMNGDGVFNSTEDIQSENLTFNEMFTITFNNTTMGGDVETCSSVDCVSEKTYGYENEVHYENGNVTTRQAAVVVSPHTENVPVVEEIPEEDDTLLMIAIASGAGAMYIGSSLVKKDEE